LGTKIDIKKTLKIKKGKKSAEPDDHHSHSPEKNNIRTRREQHNIL
jgi:hypothetical protein